MKTPTKENLAIAYSQFDSSDERMKEIKIKIEKIEKLKKQIEIFEILMDKKNAKRIERMKLEIPFIINTELSPKERLEEYGSGYYKLRHTEIVMDRKDFLKFARYVIKPSKLEIVRLVNEINNPNF